MHLGDRESLMAPCFPSSRRDETTIAQGAAQRNPGNAANREADAPEGRSTLIPIHNGDRIRCDVSSGTRETQLENCAADDVLPGS